MNILVVEDNRYVMVHHQINADSLRRDGTIPNLAFDFAVNLPEAMRRLNADNSTEAHSRIDAFISAFDFPLNALDRRGGGIELFRAVVDKYEEENRQRPPFFFLSHRSALEIGQELDQAGIFEQPSAHFDKSHSTLLHVMDHLWRSGLPIDAYKPTGTYTVPIAAPAPMHG